MNNSDEIKIDREEIKVEPFGQTGMSKESVVLSADFFKCLIDTSLGLCTLVFFHKRPNVKREGDKLILDRIDEEGFIEIKVPLNSFWATTLYSYSVLNEIRKRPDLKITYFGPSAIYDISKNTKKK